MNGKAQYHFFWNSDIFTLDELRSMIISYEKSDVKNVNSDMYHVVLYESVADKITMNIICKLLDSKAYVKNLNETMKNIIGFVCNIHDNSNAQIDDFLQRIRKEKELSKNETTH